MRKFFYFALLALFITACHSNRQTQQDTGSKDSTGSAILSDGAAIKFDTVYYDLGSLDINAPNQTRDYIFANTGSKALFINKVETSCPCLDVVYPKDSIAPGKSSKITMTLKTGEIASGQFYRSALVYTNASEEPIEIILQGIKNYE